MELLLETGSSNVPKARVGDMPPVLTPGTVRGWFGKLVSGRLNISLRAFVSFMYCEVTDVPPFGNLSLNLTIGVLGVDLEEFIIAFTLLLELGIVALPTGTETRREEGDTDLCVFTFVPAGDLSIDRRVPFVVDVVVLRDVEVPAVVLDPLIGVFLVDVRLVDLSGELLPGTRETGTAMLAPVPFDVLFRIGAALAL